MSRTTYVCAVRFSTKAPRRSFLFFVFFSVKLFQMASKCTGFCCCCWFCFLLLFLFLFCFFVFGLFNFFVSVADVHKAHSCILVDKSVDGGLPLKPACCDSNQRHSKAQGLESKQFYGDKWEWTGKTAVFIFRPLPLVIPSKSNSPFSRHSFSLAISSCFIWKCNWLKSILSGMAFLCLFVCIHWGMRGRGGE